MSGTPPRPPSTGELPTASDAVGDVPPVESNGGGPAVRRPSPVPRKASSPAPEPDESPPAESSGQDTPASAAESVPAHPEPDGPEQDEPGRGEPVHEEVAAVDVEPPGPTEEVPPEQGAADPDTTAPPPAAAMPAPPPATDGVPLAQADPAPPTEAGPADPTSADPAVDPTPATEAVSSADPTPATEAMPPADPTPATEAVPAAGHPPVDRAARTTDLDPAALVPPERVEDTEPTEPTEPTEQSLTALSLTERLPLPVLPASLDVSTTKPVSTRPDPLSPAATAPPTAEITVPVARPPRTPTGRGISTEPVSSVPIPGRATRPAHVGGGPASTPPSGPFPAQPAGPRTGPGRPVGGPHTPPHTPVGLSGRPPNRPGPPRRDPVTDPDRVRDDRVGLATARGRGTGGVVLAVVLGLLLGGPAGGAAGYLLGTQASASSLVRPVPPVVVDTADGSAAVEQTGPAALTAFLAGETVRLSDGAFAAAVAERLGRGGAPGIDVAREPGTPLLRITGTARDATSALAATTAAVQVYTERRDAENRTALDAALAGIDGVIAALGQPAPGDAALPARIDRLRDLRADVAVRAGAVGPSVAVLEPPAPLAASWPRWQLWAALGALAGAVLALVLLALRRLRTRSLLAPGALEGHVGTVLLPPVRLAARWPERLTGGPGSPERRTARLLLAQLLGEREPAGRVIVVLGGSAGSRADAVATLLAVAAAERAATALVRLGARHRGRDPLERVLPMDPDGRGRPLVDGLTVLDADTDDVPGGLDGLIAAQARRASMVVLDAGTAGGDADLPIALRAADLVVLVARSGVDRPADVAAVGASLRSGRAGLSGVVVQTG
ncbi:hypothetical protein [Pseudonocardia humida]|uniref:Capsular polysaccharide biosynthesis protein n=1 Tax=Pseudonocardia humida TaxID=2800819 RepID=A0ABT1A5G9_9PSEU|nr:hypothetical protein [Pseudonocardia humida]MCO1658252.1 hypothetical protein [Pseudonocardia humida]